MGSPIENLSFDELEPEISWDKGVPGMKIRRPTVGVSRLLLR